MKSSLVSLVLALELTACTGGATAPRPGTDASGSDAGYDAATDDAVVYCPAGAVDADSLAVGWSVSGKTVTAKLYSTDPYPPERYDNAWVVDLVDADGMPMEDMAITKAATSMPYHGHPPKTGTVESLSPGRFQLALYFQMNGYFKVELDVNSPTLGSDRIEYGYCLR